MASLISLILLRCVLFAQGVDLLGGRTTYGRVFRDNGTEAKLREASQLHVGKANLSVSSPVQLAEDVEVIKRVVDCDRVGDSKTGTLFHGFEEKMARRAKATLQVSTHVTADFQVDCDGGGHSKLDGAADHRRARIGIQGMESGSLYQLLVPYFTVAVLYQVLVPYFTVAALVLCLAASYHCNCLRLGLQCVWPVISASVLISWAYHLDLFRKGHEREAQLFVWSGMGLPSDPLDLADGSWNNFVGSITVLLLWSATHTGGQALLRKALCLKLRRACKVDCTDTARYNMQAEVRVCALWSALCTLAMLLYQFGHRPTLLPLVWAGANWILSHSPVSKQSISSDTRVSASQESNMKMSLLHPDSRAVRIVNWSLVHCVPFLFNAGVFAYVGQYTNAHYGLSTFMFMNRCISFCTDVLRFRSEDAQSDAGAQLTSFFSFVDYIFYPPLYVCGPVMSYAEFVNVRYLHKGPTNAAPQAGEDRSSKLTLMKKSTHVVHWVLLFWVFALLRHLLWPTGIARHLLASEKSTSVMLNTSLAYWFVFFAWFRWMLCWRFFRIWAEVDNIPAPENVLFYIPSLWSVRMLWREWHVSFYFWLQHYLYLPLGGSRVCWQSLNVILVFFFVFFVHNPEMTRFDSYGLVFGYFAIAVLFEVVSSRVRARLNYYFHTTLLDVIETGIFALLLLIGLPILMSMVGVNGYASTLALWAKVPHSTDMKLQLALAAALVFFSICAARFAQGSRSDCRNYPTLSISGTTASLSSWAKRKNLPPASLLLLGMLIMLQCSRLTSWDWDRFAPYLEPDRPRDGLQSSTNVPFYSSCERLRVPAFVRAPSNAISSIALLLLAAYVLWRMPVDFQNIIGHIPQDGNAGAVVIYLKIIYVASTLISIGLCTSSFLFHSSITQQAHYFDICMVLLAFAWCWAMHGGVLLLSPLRTADSHEVACLLAFLAGALPVFIMTVFLGTWHAYFGKIILASSVLQPLVLILIAERHAMSDVHVRVRLWIAFVCSLLGTLAKAFDDSQEFLKMQAWCYPDSPVQLTALLHVLYGLMAVFQFSAERLLLLSGLGVPLEDELTVALKP